MSWFSENYEKVAVAVGGIAFLSLGFYGYNNFSSVDEDFNASLKGRGSNKTEVPAADAVEMAKSSFALERKWLQGTDKNRDVDLFTGIPLFVNKNDKKNPVDLPESKPVHPPIPNAWWIENRLDPGFADSPSRDIDEDGFSHLEEFVAKTDPNDDTSYPDLLPKLTFSADKSIQWVLRPGYPSEDGGFTFEYRDTANRTNKTGAANPVAVGQIFFLKGGAAQRFKYLGFEQREEINERIQAKINITIVKVEDLKANKKGTIYEIPAKFRRADAKKFSHFDRTAVFKLDALGLEGQLFEVEENTEFSLPPGSNKSKFRLLTVTPEQVEIQRVLPDGSGKKRIFLKERQGPAN